MDNYALPSEVDRIATQEEPVVRNLRITQSYYEISTAFARRNGPLANWCTFATWASKQAGQTIRGEDLSDALAQTLKGLPELTMAAQVIADAGGAGFQQDVEQLAALLQKNLDLPASIARASAAVATGNQKVYAEIGREFARFLAEFSNDRAYDAEKIAAFCHSLRPGDPPEGQHYLREAFSHYYRSFFVEEEKAKAELCLLATIQIGLHEQTRLQPDIAGAMESALPAPDQFARRLLRRFFPKSEWFIYAFWQLLRWVGRPSRLDAAIQRYHALARQQVRLFLTRHMMTIGLPTEVLPLGGDLHKAYPQKLRQLTNPELLALLNQVDPRSDGLRESGAVDWADFPDRMHFISELFRCYLETPELLQTPFRPDQVDALKNGRLPEGDL